MVNNLCNGPPSSSQTDLARCLKEARNFEKEALEIHEQKCAIADRLIIMCEAKLRSAQSPERRQEYEQKTRFWKVVRADLKEELKEIDRIAWSGPRHHGLNV